jgi:DNA repair protein RadC
MASLHDLLQLRGAASLGDAELLSLLMEDGAEGSLERAKDLLEACGGTLAGIGRSELARLRMTAGVGLKRASRLVAAAELGRRMVALESAEAVQQITSSEDVIRLMRPRLAELGHEECWVLYLSSSNRVVEQMRISQGGVQATVVDHRLLIKRALELLATQLILIHNHPSGSAQPSEPDKELTRRVVEAAALFDIRVVDHLILSRGDSYSFRAHGAL